MKKVFGFIAVLALCFTSLFLSGCGSEPEDIEITGITMTSKSVNYDGEKHSILISGDLPEGVSVEYTNNEKIEVGTYTVTADLSGDGYVSKSLTATLTIVGQAIEGISVSDKTVNYDGNAHSIEAVVTGTLPQGVTITYKNNNQTEVGEYVVEVIISGSGYNTITLFPTLTIVGQDITGVSFNDKTVDYNTNSQSIEITGTLPQDAEVKYQNASGTNAGEYNATVTITAKGYNPLTLSAKLTINKIDLTGISFEEKTVDYNGEVQTIEIIGAENLPSDAKVVYENNKGTEQGTYKAKVTITSTNYNDFVAEANLVIKALVIDGAAAIINQVFSMPDPWEFLPESFELENRSATQQSYTSFVNVSSIPTNGIGKQLNVVYDALVDTQSLLGYVNIINKSLTAITTAYQIFINQNPDDYSVFSDTEGLLTYQIQLDGNDIEFFVKYLSVVIEFTYTADDSTNVCRIQLTDSNAIKYESSEETVSIATTILNLKNSLIVFDFSNDNVTNGWVYEFMGISSLHTTTEAFFSITDSYTTVVSNKKDSDDLSISYDVEVYSNSTGQLIGSEVGESILSKDYDTYWFNLKDLSGINSIKVTDEVNSDNDKNANTIYLNGSSTKFVETWNTVIVYGKTSRKQDIEMRTQYFYNFDSETEEYVKEAILVPMFFVQDDDVTDVSSNFNSENGYSVTLTANYSLINTFYSNVSTYWESIKGLITFSDVIDFIGSKNEFFN